MIEVDLLLALGVHTSNAKLYAPLLDDACPQWGIDEPDEVAAFLANCAHESGGFAVLEENLNYSAEALRRLWPNRVSVDVAKRIARKPELIANVVYANRMGNGDYDSGDGWAYRGHGLLGVTGKDNHRAFSYAWGVDCVAEPERLAEPTGAVVSACWFWAAHGCNELAQAKRWEDLCRRINGGLNGFDERMALINTALQYLK